ncbi:MAG: tetratricopeptide repeat protein [Clostridia bacterium]|nr:tetratricopeptide repeat protein [Clostridia bacterium]
MLNLKQELMSYPPIDINSLTEKDSSIPDNIINSIILYNKALENIRMNSEDIAVIELKKAISMNPNFHEAMNLLGICYVFTKDYPKAREIFEKVAALENNGVKALSYLNMINTGSVSVQDTEIRKGSAIEKKPLQAAAKMQNAFKSISTPVKPEKMNLAFSSGLFKMIGGFVAGILVMILFLLIIKTPGKSVEVLNDRINQGESQNKTESTANQESGKLKEENEKLQNELKSAKAELDYYASVSKLGEAERLSAAKNYEAAADLLVMMKTMQLKDTEKSRYDSLYNSVIPKAAWAVFNEGNSLVKYKKYQEALTKLSKVQVYGDSWNYLDATLYKMGVCYKEMNESKNALEVFKKLIEKYPKSQYASYANYKISELTGAP